MYYENALTRISDCSWKGENAMENKLNKNSKLNRVTLKGYKSIKNLDLEFRPLNVLIGANGAGKSNFASFIRLLNFMTSNNLQLYVGKNGGADKLLYCGSKRTKEVEAELYFENDAGKNVYYMRIVKAAGDTFIFADEQVAFSKRQVSTQAPLKSLGAGHKESLLVNYHLINDDGLRKTANVIGNIINQWRFYQFHDTSDEAAIKQKVYIEDNQYLRDNAGNLASFLYAMKHREQHQQYYKRIVNTIKLVAPFFDDFILEPDVYNEKQILLRWRERDSGMVFDANQLSDGTLRMMALITLLQQPSLPSLICIDEPELGLHPFAINVLSELLKGASAKSQIIVSTQSVTLVDTLEPEDLIVVDKKDGESVFRRVDKEKLSEWMDEYTLGQIWEKNVIGGRPSR